MADFAGFEDWGLQAIVGGSGSNMISMVDNNQQQYQYCSTYSNMWTSMPTNDHDHHHDHDHHDHFRFAFTDGLEALYKPFYPISETVSTVKEVKDEVEEVKEKLQIDQQLEIKHLNTDCSPKYKKSRKNQHKRVVMQVKAGDLSSDKWAWRKYGQKPIKGSIYPRSYYKCSSMKGCLARKQVEQSCSDPTKYIITYTAEHCHSHPTRRNSLAGTVRNKFPTIDHNENSTKMEDKYSINSTFSPSSSKSSEEEISARKIKQEKLEDDHQQQLITDFSFSDIIMNDDFFAALDDFDGSSLEL